MAGLKKQIWYPSSRRARTGRRKEVHNSTPETLARWHDEGLPRDIDAFLAIPHFDMDMRIPILLGGSEDPGFFPLFERRASVRHVELASNPRFQGLFVEFMQLGAETSAPRVRSQAGDGIRPLARSAACVALRSTRYSSAKRCCLAVSGLMSTR
jgi:hypothetical protein